MRTMLIAAGVILGSVALAAEPPAPAFTTKPTATRAGDPSTGSGQGKVRIEFAVDRETDVAVFVEDGAGKVVRHLVAGVLGDNPPAPLKPGLAQSVEWDGKADYGKPAGSGPFRVRVALGLGARYDKVLLSTLTASTGARCAGVGSDGTLYLFKSSRTFGGEGLLAFNRDGSYQRSLTPFPANLPLERAKGFDPFELDGRAAPLPHNQVHGLYPQPGWGARKFQLPVSREGRIYLVGGKPGKYNKRPLSSGVIYPDGGCPEDEFAVPLKLPAGIKGLAPSLYYMGMALSGDESRLYVTGLGDNKGSFPVVFRIALPERNAIEMFFGDVAKSGKSETHLNNPRGLAVDGKGNLLVADQSNNRIVVISEKDGGYAGEFPVQSPDTVAVDRNTGAVYVTRNVGKNVYELQKFAGWKNPQPVATAKLTWQGHPSCPPIMAIDASASPVVVWLQEDYGRLIRVEDRGTSFGDGKLASSEEGSETGFMDLTVDRVRDEVYMRGCHRNNGAMYWWYRYDEKSDKLSRLDVGPFSSSAGAQLVPAPGGNLYGASYRSGIFKFTHDGKPDPWENPIRGTGPEANNYANKVAHCTFMPVSECWMRHVLGVRHDGHIFAFEPGKNGGRPTRMLREYLPSGQLARQDPIIWKVSDGSIGPKFDPEGNVYVAEIVKPADRIYPPEFEKKLGRVDPAKDRLAWGSPQASASNIYGSIVKFTPKGGMVDINVVYAGVRSDNPYPGTPKLDSSLKTEDYVYDNGAGGFGTVKVTGAEWVRMGCSHVFVGECTCDSTRFDVDEFGRVWYPDQGRFRVCVLDTNGNDLTHFGGYGNADSRGPESTDKAMATPDIAFSWLVGVGVTDRHVYTGDSLNRRMLRSKVTYAAEETCAVR